ncbi:RHS repeat-associated core domain-containing protein [Roseibium sp.]|uniref:RHS repeat-associated core domain-containing protein n=1 Tax=Roseibium sp. TaxID=1936156 RepID=UPI003BB14368
MAGHKPAARLMDQISHTSALSGFLGGALLGLAAGVAIVAVTVATGGAALAVVAAAGAAAATTGGGALVGAALGATFSSPCGTIAPTCSLNVLVNNRPAARAIIDGALCSMHAPGPPKPIATGVERILINTFPAARKDEKITCGAFISSGSKNVKYGGASGQFLAVASEVPAWMLTTAKVLAIGGTIVAVGAGAAAAYVAGGTCALLGFGAETVGAFAFGFAGGEVGGYIGEAIGGERGRIIGQTLGSFVGGIFGAKLGGRLARGHPVDMATGEVFTQETDFELPGPIPLTMTRVWMSSSSETGRTGGLGSKWHHSLAIRLHRWQDGNCFALRLADGRLALFASPRPGQPSLNAVERLLLETDGQNYRVRDYDGQCLYFKAAARTDDIWLIASIADANGHTIRFAYGTEDQLAGVIDSGGRELTVATDVHGRILRIDAPHPTDASSRMTLVSYGYSGNDLTTVTDARGNVQKYAYQNHLIVEERHRGGLSYTFEWDDTGRGTEAKCIRTWGTSASGAITGLHYVELKYRPDTFETFARDRLGNITIYQNDGRGHVMKQTDPDGLVTKFAYDQAGNLSLKEDGFGRKTSGSWDRFGRQTASLEEDGTSTRLSYPTDSLSDLRFGKASVVASSETGEHRFAFDTRGNVEIYTDPVGVEHRYVRDTRGHPLAVLDREGTSWRWQWSSDGNLIAEGPDDLRASYEHDGLGRVIRVRDPSGCEVAIARDENGNATDLQYADGGRVSMAYDADNRVLRHTDEAGQSVEWSYDGLRVPLTRTEADGSATRFGYDDELRPTLIVDASGKDHRLRYDARGRLISEIGFDRRQTDFHYDPATGFLASVRNGGDLTSYERDPYGRVLEKHFSDGTKHTFAWSSNNRVTSAVTPDCELSFAYDAAQRIVSESQNGAEIQHEYDPRGQLATTTLPDGRTISYAYNRTGDCKTVSFEGREVAAYLHDHLGRTISRKSGGIACENEFDPQGRLVRQSAYARTPGIDEEIVRRTYQWRQDNKLLSVKDSRRGTRQYAYDTCNRLTSAQGWTPEAFIYDLSDNLVAAARTSPLTSPQPPGEASGNRLTVFGDKHFTYDAQGNIVREVSGAGGHTETEYVYGANGMLREVRRSGRRGETLTCYGYDAFNRRIAKTVTHDLRAANSTGGESVPIETRYLWNGDVLLAESTSSDDPLETVYLFEPLSFTPLAMISRHPQRTGIYIYNTDHQGVPYELIAEDGSVAWAATYLAFGGARVVTGADFYQPLRFPGQYFDDESGLHYNRNRYYDPALGRYTQPDPISLLGGLNAYAYALDPNGFIDPFGLTPLDATGYSLYHIVNNKTGEVVYVGITNDVSSRTSAHKGTGRLGRGYSLKVQKTDLTYAQVRGYEQADIKQYGTRDTSRIGKAFKRGEPNRVWSYDPARTDERAKAFNEHYDERMKTHGGCS